MQEYNEIEKAVIKALVVTQDAKRILKICVLPDLLLTSWMSISVLQ